MKEYYVMTPPGTQKSHYDGPYDTVEESISFLKEMCSSPYASPEMQKMVIVYLDKSTNIMDLFLDEAGNIVNGQKFLWGEDENFGYNRAD